MRVTVSRKDAPRRYSRTRGAADGSIIAAIMMVHAAMKATALTHVARRDEDKQPGKHDGDQQPGGEAGAIEAERLGKTHSRRHQAESELETKSCRDRAGSNPVYAQSYIVVPDRTTRVAAQT